MVDETVPGALAPHLVIERPRLRGRLHALVFFLALPAGTLLIIFAERAAARAAAAIYVASLLAVFGTSAAYHRLAQSPRARAVMQRLDHSMIYLLITGSYVPLCIVALPPAWGIPVLCVVGAGAVTGIVLKLAAFGRANWFASALYPGLGWAAVAVAPMLVRVLSPMQLMLLVAGGLAYTIGFPVLVLRRPDPWPRTFGYHEIWHTFTVVAAVCHFVVVASVVA